MVIVEWGAWACMVMAVLHGLMWLNARPEKRAFHVRMIPVWLFCAVLMFYEVRQQQKEQQSYSPTSYLGPGGA